MHNQSIVYRNIKPENIFFDEKGYVTLSDFEFCIRLEPDEKALSFGGTAEYISPEMLKGEKYDHSVDLWSLGILIYEMYFGSPPF